MTPAVQAILKEGRKILRETKGIRSGYLARAYLMGRAVECVRICDIIGPDAEEMPEVRKLMEGILNELQQRGLDQSK